MTIRNVNDNQFDIEASALVTGNVTVGVDEDIEYFTCSARHCVDFKNEFIRNRSEND